MTTDKGKECNCKTYGRNGFHEPTCQSLGLVDEGKEWRESHDYKQAVYAADKALDEPYADPDDDLRTISRQFLRMIERYDSLQSLLTKHDEELIERFGGMKYKGDELLIDAPQRAEHNQTLDLVIQSIKNEISKTR